MPRVAVIMAVFNASPYLRRAIESILNQTYSDFELIAVDDNSTDDSLTILESINDPRLRILRHSVNQGAAVSRNDAFAAATGEFIAVMDADDISAPIRLERQVAFLSANPSVDLVGCAVYDNIDEDGEVLCTSFLPVENDVIQKTLVHRWCFLHSSIMVRRDAIVACGGYRTVFEPAEDHDLILRVLDQRRAHNLSERLVSYRLNPQGLSVTGHIYMDELGNLAMRAAQRRRRGEEEGIEAELPKILLLKQTTRSTWISATIWAWRNSFYAAQRYYGFGCQGLCLGNMRQARYSFRRALRTNALLPKAWAGLALTWIPALAARSSVLFSRSRAKLNDRDLFHSDATLDA